MTQRQRALTNSQTTEILTSNDFLSYVEAQQTAAQRRRDDHQGAIEELMRSSARLKADYEQAVQRNNVLIADHRLAIDDEQAIIAAADRALDFGRVTDTAQEQQE